MSCTNKIPLRTIGKANCKDCSLSDLCLPIALKVQDIDKLDHIIKRGRPIKKGDMLFMAGDKSESIFAVRSGTLKSFKATDEGEEQITGFHLPSELVGMSGIASDEGYPITAQALETSSVCEIPFAQLESLSEEIPELRHQLFKLMGQEIRDDQQMMLLLSKKTAEARVATFLIYLSSRFKRRGFSSSAFRLTMSRSEIGNYLGLAVETVSRVFTRFQKQEILSADGKNIEILDMDNLCTIGAGNNEKLNAKAS